MSRVAMGQTLKEFGAKGVKQGNAKNDGGGDLNRRRAQTGISVTGGRSFIIEGILLQLDETRRHG